MGADDTLASVARSYHVTVDQLASVNQLQPNESLENVEALVVPVPPPTAAIRRAEMYKAHRGDTLVKIADRFGVSLEDLRRWNTYQRNNGDRGPAYSRERADAHPHRTRTGRSKSRNGGTKVAL